jgi:branched-chain amino acid transport system permease protein
MEFFAQVLVSGLFTSSLYASLALGVTLLFGILRIGDLAQGALYAAAGYLLFVGTKLLGLPIYAAAPAAVLIVIFLSTLNGRFVYRPLQRLGLGPTFVGGVAVLIILQNLLAIGFTWEPYALLPPSPDSLIRIGGAILPPQKLIVILFALTGSLGLWLFLRKTFAGKALRALAQNREAAQLVGVDVVKVSAIAFAIAGLASAVPGVVMATLWPITPYAGTLLILKAFAITILGMGRIRGALLGALLVGMSEAFMQGYGSAALSDLVPFLLLAFVLVLKPHALGPEEEAERAYRLVEPRKLLKKNSMSWLPWGMLFLAAILPLILHDNFWLHLLILMGLNILLVSGLDLLNGYTGIPSLAQAGLFGIGAYASALLAMRLKLDFPLTLLGAAGITMIAASLIGLLGLRLSGRWTSFTFLVGVVITLLLESFAPGGSQGLTGVPGLKASLPGIGAIAINPFNDKLSYFYLVLLFVFIFLWLKSRIVDSRFGRALLAIREDEVLAKSVGIPADRYKLRAFVINAAFAGVAGSLYAHYLVYLNPDLFTFSQSFNLYVMNLVGGAATLFGSVLGPAVLTLFAELSRPLSGSIAEIVFGTLLILMLIYMPMGMMGLFRKVLSMTGRRSDDLESASEMDEEGAR